MTWLDKKYINLLSSRLEKFQWRGNTANFRCPLCFDSTTNKNLKRGYFYEMKDKWNYCCKRCGAGMSFPNLLKKLDSNLYNEYKSELIHEKYKPTTKETDFSSSPQQRLSVTDDIKELEKLRKISQIDRNHPAVQYMEKRKIPGMYYHIFRWTPGFMEWTNNLLPKKFSTGTIRLDAGRIVIPFFNKEGKFHAFQGRSLDNDLVRYISIQLDETVPLIWGLDRIDTTQTVYAFEGVMDALFIPNSLAICGGNFSGLRTVVDPANTVVVYDNEPRSAETKKKIQKAILEGFQVCIWPSHIVSKDVNEMVLNEGLTPDSIQRIMNENTYHGLKASVALVEWSKV